MLSFSNDDYLHNAIVRHLAFLLLLDEGDWGEKIVNFLGMRGGEGAGAGISCDFWRENVTAAHHAQRDLEKMS